MFDESCELAIDLVRAIGRRWKQLKVGKCDNKTAKKMDALPIPYGLSCFLYGDWPTKTADVGPYCIYTVREMLSNRSFEALKEKNMVRIGGCFNGDLVVLRVRPKNKTEVGLISHDVFLEDHAGEARLPSYYVKIADSLDEFLLRLVDDLYLPSFYDAAKRVQKLRTKMKK